jgi:DNA-binding CsgD family transcriptional regulator
MNWVDLRVISNTFNQCAQSRRSHLREASVILRPGKLTILEDGTGTVGAMAKHDHRTDDSLLAKWTDANPHLGGEPEVVQLSAIQARAAEDAAAVVARQLNGPLTALMLYMNELKQQSHQFSQAPGNRIYLQQVVDNALQQTERVYALVKQLADGHAGATEAIQRKPECASNRASEHARGVMLSSESDQKPLTRREREVLALISEGCSNKQGALRMQISPRTFESHRAEAMRKLGARNTADLVRKALLLHPA